MDFKEHFSDFGKHLKAKYEIKYLRCSTKYKLYKYVYFIQYVFITDVAFLLFFSSLLFFL